MNIDHQDQLADYLNRHLQFQPGRISYMETLEGGVSNRTKKIGFTNGESWVIKQALSKLRVEGEWYSDPSRILREAEALRWFGRSEGISTPGFIYEDPEEYLLIMEAVEPSFENFKTWLLEGNFNTDYIRQCGKLLGAIHSGYGEVPEMFHDRRFFESLRLQPYYVESMKVLPECASFFKDLIEETRNSSWCVVHGDFSPKNILLKDKKIILLDHEVIHFGDGCFDLGFFITHLLAKAIHIPENRESLIEAVELFFGSYKDQLKNITSDIESRAVRHSIGCLLARVCGLSPLEYLSEEERQIQTTIAVTCSHDPSPTIRQFTQTFKEILDASH